MVGGVYHCTGGEAGDWGSLKGEEGAVLKPMVGDSTTVEGGTSGVYPWRVKDEKTGGGGRVIEEGPAEREDWEEWCMVRSRDALQRETWQSGLLLGNGDGGGQNAGRSTRARHSDDEQADDGDSQKKNRTSGVISESFPNCHDGVFNKDIWAKQWMVYYKVRS